MKETNLLGLSNVRTLTGERDYNPQFNRLVLIFTISMQFDVSGCDSYQVRANHLDNPAVLLISSILG